MALLPPPVTEGSETFNTLRFHVDPVERPRRWLANRDPSEVSLPRDMAHDQAFACSFPVPAKHARVASFFDMDEGRAPMRSDGTSSSYVASNAAILDPLAVLMKQEQFTAATEGQELPNWLESDASNYFFAHNPVLTASDFITTHIPASSRAIVEVGLNDEGNADNIALEKLFLYRPMLETAHHDTFQPLNNEETAQFAQSTSAVTAFHDPPWAPKKPWSGASRPPSVVTTTSSIDDHTMTLVSAFPRELEPGKRAKIVRNIPSSGACDVCGKYFFKSGALACHARAAHPKVYVLPRQQSSTSLSSSADGKHQTGRINCPRCPKTFSQQGSLNRHLRSIHEARKLHCKYCDMAFGQAFDLKRHHKRKHPGSVPFVPSQARPRFAIETFQ